MKHTFQRDLRNMKTEGRKTKEGLCLAARTMMSSLLHSGQRINACGQWVCSFPHIYNSEILHPIPLSSINSSHVHIQFKIPPLVFNPPWTSAVYPTSRPPSDLSSHLPLLLFHRNLLPSFLTFQSPTKSSW